MPVFVGLPLERIEITERPKWQKKLLEMQFLTTRHYEHFGWHRGLEKQYIDLEMRLHMLDEEELKKRRRVLGRHLIEPETDMLRG